MSDGVGPSILTLELEERIGQFHDPALYPGDRTDGAPSVGDWLEPRAVMDAVE